MAVSDEQDRVAAPAGAARFDAVYAHLIACLVAGGVLDGWAHNRGLADDTFFTPWHAALYGSLAVTGAWLLAWRARHGRLPPGHELAPIGLGAFAAGGLGDLAWHSAFGVERSVEASLSPPHLVVFVAFGMLALGPWRAAGLRWPAGAALGWRAWWPPATSVWAVGWIFAYATQFAHPFTTRWPEPVPPFTASGAAALLLGEAVEILRPALGVAGLILQSAALTIAISVVLRRYRPPPGAFAVLLGMNALAMAALRERWEWVAVGVVAGAVVDVVIRPLGPDAAGPRWLAAVAIVPAVWVAAYLGVLAAAATLAWSPTLVLGAVASAAVVGGLTAAATGQAG